MIFDSISYHARFISAWLENYRGTRDLGPFHTLHSQPDQGHDE